MTSKLLVFLLVLSSFGLAQGVAGDPGVWDSGSASAPTTYNDPFTAYGSGSDLAASSGGNWAYPTGSSSVYLVQSVGVIKAVSASHMLAYWSGTGFGSFTANQFSSTTIGSALACCAGPAVEIQTGSTSGYFAQCAIGTGCRLEKIVSGTPTALAAYTGTIVTGDVIRLEAAVSGSTTTLTMKQNGSTIQTFADSTSAYLTGTPGLYALGGGGNTFLTQASGGNN